MLAVALKTRLASFAGCVAAEHISAAGIVERCLKDLVKLYYLGISLQELAFASLLHPKLSALNIQLKEDSIEELLPCLYAH